MFHGVQNVTGVYVLWSTQKHAEKKWKVSYSYRHEWISKNECYYNRSTFTLSTHSIFKCSGIAVIQSPFVSRKNIPCSAANHMSYSPKFWIRENIWLKHFHNRVNRKWMWNRESTLSNAFLSLPLRTTTVFFRSLQSAVSASFNSGCNLSSISLIWSALLPGVSTGSVNVALNPCTWGKKASTETILRPLEIRYLKHLLRDTICF